jgi:5-methylcytosine-specific restriction endonuclease McrA
MPRERYKLWIGRNDRVMPPHDVQLRIVKRYKGCCARCQNKLAIGRWAMDHVIPLEDGGVNAEGNCQPLCTPCHGLKTGAENSERAKVRAKAKADLGIKTPTTRPLRSAGFPKRREARPKPPLQPKPLFWAVGQAESD